MSAIFAAHAMLVPLVPLAALAMGASPISIGALISSSAWLPLLLGMAIGKATDSVGARKVLVLGASGITIVPIIVVLYESLWALALSQLLIGLFHLSVMVAAQTYIASIGSKSTHQFNFGWYTTFVSVGQLLGPVLAGIVTDSINMRAAFITVCILGGLSMLLFPFLDRKQTTKQPAIGGEGAPRNVHVLRSPTLQVSMIVSSVLVFSMSTYQTFLPLLIDNLGHPATHLGLLLGTRAFASALVRPFMGKVVSKLRGRRRALLATAYLAALALSLIALTPHLLVIGIASVLMGLGLGIAMPLTIVVAVDDKEPSVHGQIIGVRLTGNFLAQLVGPLIVGLIAQTLGVQGAFWASGVLVILIGTVVLPRRLLSAGV